MEKTAERRDLPPGQSCGKPGRNGENQGENRSGKRPPRLKGRIQNSMAQYTALFSHISGKKASAAETAIEKENQKAAFPHCAQIINPQPVDEKNGEKPVSGD